VHLRDYTTATDPNSHPTRHIFYAELKTTSDVTQVLSSSRLQELSDAVDSHVRSMNALYDFMRVKGSLASVHVRILRPGAFRQLVDILVSRGAARDQVKIPRLLHTPELVAFMQNQCVI
jgi:hypothetical protein